MGGTVLQLCSDLHSTRGQFSQKYLEMGWLYLKFVDIVHGGGCANYCYCRHHFFLCIFCGCLRHTAACSDPQKSFGILNGSSHFCMLIYHRFVNWKDSVLHHLTDTTFAMHNSTWTFTL